MDNWDKQVFHLPENHGWTAKPGNVVFVADRGALRFEIPREWTMEPSRKSVKFLDAKPPDDSISLEVSITYLAAYGRNVDWSGLPLSDLLKGITDEESPARPGKRKARKRKDANKVSAPLTIKMGDLELAWVETEFIDPGEKRPAYSRIGLARDARAAIQALLTMSFWPEDADRAKAVWNDVLGTLKIGEYFDSPLHGPGYRSEG